MAAINVVRALGGGRRRRVPSAARSARQCLGGASVRPDWNATRKSRVISGGRAPECESWQKERRVEAKTGSTTAFWLGR